MGGLSNLDNAALPLRFAAVTEGTPQRPAKSAAGRLVHEETKRKALAKEAADGPSHGMLGRALTDTPMSTAPSSPKVRPLLQQQEKFNDAPSTVSTPRVRPTTLDVPGLTRSKVSPDGRIASIDIGSKLVIVMVGLPARGKSYITKKIARYLNWLQHDTRIFNVGERRRVAAGTPLRTLPDPIFPHEGVPTEWRGPRQLIDAPAPAAAAVNVLVNGEPQLADPASEPLPPPAAASTSDRSASTAEHMDQSADFFDPQNIKAARLREQVALATLDELLDYILNQGGSVGILDATNSTLDRRQLIRNHILDRAGPELGVLFVESLCLDQELLESNMRLKLSGPDYKGQEPRAALADFKRRVEIYERNYVPLGEFEEKHHMQYVQMIDVGRKMVAHQIRGFLAAQTVYYLVNFNLVPRMIWITRHGESVDNVRGRIGGDSDLTENGRRYARALARFIAQEHQTWTVKQQDRAASARLPPRPGDGTPPYNTGAAAAAADKHFCVWTSMLRRSIQTAEAFNEDDYDVKQMRMLDELHAGIMDGLTYDDIRTRYPDEYEHRRRDKLHYRYPGPGGEGYLDVIHRLRSVIVEIERMTDHVLLVGHRSIARVLLAYFLGLRRDAVADVDVPLGVVYMLQPKPYGVAFKAFRYHPSDDRFHLEPRYQMSRASSHNDV